MRKPIRRQFDHGIFLLGHDMHNRLHRKCALLDGLRENGKHLVHLLVTGDVHSTGRTEFTKVGAASIVAQHGIHSRPGHVRLWEKHRPNVRGSVGFLAVGTVAVNDSYLGSIDHGLVRDFAASAAARNLSFSTSSGHLGRYNRLTDDKFCGEMVQNAGKLGID